MNTDNINSIGIIEKCKEPVTITIECSKQPADQLKIELRALCDSIDVMILFDEDKIRVDKGTVIFKTK
ncbi:MAG: hypothetical protein PHY47_22920 [Lachnospiraceae bacterium]|nr:hypothetical protein [Lachnospiraceae bacterium]